MLKLKSLKEPSNPDDGLRILIALYRPRYLPKNKENWNQWWKDLAPSKALFKEFLKDKRISWNEYERKFRWEIKNNPSAIEALDALIATIASIIVVFISTSLLTKNMSFVTMGPVPPYFGHICSRSTSAACMPRESERERIQQRFS